MKASDIFAGFAHELQNATPSQGTGVKVAAEFAPGIPESRAIKPVPEVNLKDKNPEWLFTLQKHIADVAGPHFDLRLTDPEGDAHSWAIPGAVWPAPGEKTLAPQQPTHTGEYAKKPVGEVFKLPKGAYGAGKVKPVRVEPAEIVEVTPNKIKFNLYKGKDVEELALIKTPQDWLLTNFTATQGKVRGVGGHEVPTSKPKYQEVKPEDLQLDKPDQIMQAKLDGSHVTYHLRSGKPTKVFSHRPGKRTSGLIEHTHKIPNWQNNVAPAGLGGTVLRGELYAAKGGKAIPAERIGGILNANVWKSREKQKEEGKLRQAVFDVVRYKGRDVSHLPYGKRLDLLKDVVGKVPSLHIPKTAVTPEQKERLLERIKSGKEKSTEEGVVLWRTDKVKPPVKVKFRPDYDVKITGTFPGQGKYEGSGIGGFLVNHEGTVNRVGTGLSDEVRRKAFENPELFKGLVARIQAQQVFPSGKMRAPSFKNFHLDKNTAARLTALALEKLSSSRLRRMVSVTKREAPDLIQNKTIMGALDTVVRKVRGHGLKDVEWGMNVGGKRVGTMYTEGGRITGSEIDPAFRGMGLGKKFYGEVMRRSGGKLSSDNTVSQKARRVWEGMRKRKGYRLKADYYVDRILKNKDNSLSSAVKLLQGKPIYTASLPPQAKIASTSPKPPKLLKRIDRKRAQMAMFERLTRPPRMPVDDLYDIVEN